ncbi:allantoin racemase [Polaromonas sp. OV174]|uniref:aspartate/glutamate racemase family protein n=1 Tax=Polaromonas sp. OV174 TaxID=1855300 RepID=UPI0008E3FFDD|nr:aspartate/glutamate racemase family protein [Polaromonas sp. OV174]SFB85320.1 allantoin racemase [Polaromonas sp. OV174]
MKIQLINPNTTIAMTAKMAMAARQVASAGTQILAVQSATGPASIESAVDEALALPGLLAQIQAGEAAGVDAHVIACFGDPGLRAAREIASAPVIGIAEAAMQLACLVSASFSVVTTLASTVPTARRLLQDYGMTGRCARVRATGIAVLELEANTSELLRQKIGKECRLALAEDGVGAIVLGCAGMADLCTELTEELGVPVIDGVTAAVKLAEALVGLNLRTSKQGDYARPGAKPYIGVMAQFALAA